MTLLNSKEEISCPSEVGKLESLDFTCIWFESQFGLLTVIEVFVVFLSTKRGNYVILLILSHFINHCYYAFRLSICCSLVTRMQGKIMT
jgi:hypothetical protein